MLTGERISLVRNKLGINQTELAKKTNISRSVMNRIELGTRPIRDDELKTIAKVLDVSADYLLGNENNSLPELNKKDERDIAKELEKMMSDLDSDGGLSFYGEPLDDDNKEILRTSLENTLRLSKQLAKKKFTPKKYRKE